MTRFAPRVRPDVGWGAVVDGPEQFDRVGGVLKGEERLDRRVVRMLAG